MLNGGRESRQVLVPGEPPRAGAMADALPVRLPNVTLRHGQVVWLLTELGYSAGVSRSTFHEYIKSLRKLGIPFGRGTVRSQHKARADYSYCQVMELAITLSLRVYHVVPDSVLREIIRNRSRLCRLYRKAYAQRRSGSGSPILLKAQDGRLIGLYGLFLDLDIRFSGGQLVGFGPPKLLSPTEALVLFAERMLAARAFLPLSVSLLSERVVSFALSAPIPPKRLPSTPN
jgi:hypothetical protein